MISNTDKLKGVFIRLSGEIRSERRREVHDYFVTKLRNSAVDVKIVEDKYTIITMGLFVESVVTDLREIEGLLIDELDLLYINAVIPGDETNEMRSFRDRHLVRLEHEVVSQDEELFDPFLGVFQALTAACRACDARPFTVHYYKDNDHPTHYDNLFIFKTDVGTSKEKIVGMYNRVLGDNCPVIRGYPEEPSNCELYPFIWHILPIGSSAV